MSHRSSLLARARRTALIALLACSGVAASAGGLIAAGPAQAATLATVTLAVAPSSITVGGTLQSGGVNIVSSVAGVKEANFYLFRLKPGVTPAELYAFLESKTSKEIDATSKFGSIVFSTEAEAGHPSEVQTNLAPGQYVALGSHEEGGSPKLRASFTVATASAAAALPSPQATIRAIDFGFAGPKILHNGELVGVENEGWVVHMNIALQVKNLNAAKRLVKLLLAGKERQARKFIIGGLTLSGPVSHGAYQQLTIHAKPGVYVEVCFSETQDRRDHTRLGMMRIMRVVR